MKIADALSGVARLYFDSAALIYYIELHPNYAAKMREIFTRVDNRQIVGITSAVTLAEVLVDPLRRGDAKLAQDYRELLYNTEFETISVTSAIGERAAQLRVTHNLKTPDALHLAAAIASACDAFLSNDRRLLPVSGVTVLVLDDLDL